MIITMCILWGEQSWLLNFPEEKRVFAGEDKWADIVIPGFGKELQCYQSGKGITVEIREKRRKQKLQTVLDTFLVLDPEERLAVYFTRNQDTAETVPLPADGEVVFGRKRAEPGPGKTSVVIGLPFVSGKHFRLLCTNGRISVQDTGSRNGLFLNGRRVRDAELQESDVLSVLTVRMTYRDQALCIENAGGTVEVFAVPEKRGLQAAHLRRGPDKADEYRRSPRLAVALHREEIALEKPPQAGGPPQINWLSVLAMPAISIVLMLVLVLALGMSPIMLIMSGVMSAASAVIAIITYRKQKNRHGKTENVIREKYQQYLSEVECRLKEAHARQKTVLEQSNPSPAECCRIAQEREPRLWERRPEDDDFLTVRLGVGEIDAEVTAAFQRPQVIIREDVLEGAASNLAEKSRRIPNAPILCSLKSSRHVGIVGSSDAAIRLAGNMLVELAAMHACDELKIVVLTSEQDLPWWSWMRWLPHCAENGEDQRYLFASQEEAEEPIRALEEIVKRRKQEEKERYEPAGSAAVPHYLFVVDDLRWTNTPLICSLLQSQETLGCSVIYIQEQRNLLPKECGRIIDVRDGRGESYDRRDSAQRVSFVMDGFSFAQSEQFARSLASLTMGSGGTAGIPRSVTFLEGCGAETPEALDIPRRWSQAIPFQSLSVPIAVGTNKEVFCFDIHEKQHGVNGVVAGMPGSGKTEMVQSWLLSMAVNFSPQDVSFVLIDFKGSGMIAPFRNLPHLAGSISNLDTNIDRNLIAIRSEVQRREALLDRYSDQNIKNVNDLNKNYCKGLVPEKLPILLIVIDEYAEFKKVFPDFGAEIDSLTSKGRALGMFVILMTQKPAGVVSAKSEDNLKFRWCLRVANYSASREMLGRPDAARITIPGRAYVKVGEDDVYEQVQAFWSGAPYDPGRRERKRDADVISLVAPDGRMTPCEEIRTGKTGEEQGLEIDVVVRWITEYCRRRGIPSAQRIWTDRLPDQLYLEDILSECFGENGWPEKTHRAVPVGIADDPAHQRQYPLLLDPAKDGHTVIYGVPAAGKTTMLKTFVMSAAMSRRPDEAWVYIMDFGGWNLSVLKELPHVGALANDNEPERIEKMAVLLQELLKERKELFSSAGVGSLSGYRDATGQTIPEIFLVLDNFGPVLKRYPALEPFFIEFTGSGTNYGMYLVATATAYNNVPYKIAQNIKNPVALQMIDKSDYTYLVGKVNSALPAVIGRGFVKGTPPLEFQAALPARGQNDKSISDRIRHLAAEMNQCWRGASPRKLPVMPETIPYGSVHTPKPCLGLSVTTVVPLCYDFDTQHYLMISGTEQSGKSNMLQVVVKQLKERMGGSVYVFALEDQPLSGLRELSDVILTSPREIDQFVENLRPELQKRQREKQQEHGRSFPPIILAVDDYSELFRQVSNDTVARLLAVIKLGHGLGLYLIMTSDAYGLTSLYNKGEAVSIAIAKGAASVLLGGCLNDHGAFPVRGSYAQKSALVRQREGFFLNHGEAERFRAMACGEGNVK